MEIGPNGRKQWNLGDVVNLAQLGMLIASLCFGLIKVGAIEARFDAILAQVGHHSQQLDRVEHYLSSKDAKYWQQSREDQ